LKSKTPWHDGFWNLLTGLQPLFFMYGEQIATVVPTMPGVHYQAFYLPKVCGLPLGLTCDGVLATGTPDACQLLAIFLAQGESAITSTSYFGAKTPGQFCPNIYYFKVVNHWPT
jgi:hypothetical protein